MMLIQPVAELCPDSLARVSGGRFRLKHEYISVFGNWTPNQLAAIKDKMSRLRRLGLDHTQAERILSKHRDVLIPMR